MNRLLLILGCAFGISSAWIQAGEPRPEFVDQYRKQHIAFITQEVSFSPAEAQQFWPVYDEYEEKKFALLREVRKTQRAFKKRIDRTDQDYRAQLNRVIELREKELELLKEYYGRMAQVISPKSMWLFFEAEERFVRDFMRTMPRPSSPPAPKP